MPHLLNIWSSVSCKLSASSRILLLFDYDGTLTPIVARPELALLPRDTRRLLTLLSGMDRFTVGVVSGRGLADLESLVAIPGLVYAGNHGLEMSGAGMEYVHPGAPKFVDSLVEVGGLLEQKLAEVPGILVDNKRLTLTIHFRNTPDSYITQVEHTVVAVTKPNQVLHLSNMQRPLS